MTSEEKYAVVLLIEQALSAADAAQVRELHRELDDDPTIEVHYHVLLPVVDAAAAVEASLGVIGGADHFLVLHNAHGPEFELGLAPAEPTGVEGWRPLLPHDPGVRLEDVDGFADHVVVQQRDHARQRANPAQGFGADRGSAPAHRLGPGKAADDRGDRLGEHLDRRTAGLVDDGEVNAIAIFQLILRQPGLAEEAFERLRRRAAARPFDFLADRSGRLRKPLGDQRKSARGRPDGQIADVDARRCHLRAEQLFQLGKRARLHPRGDFLAAQFEKKVGHSTHPGYFSVQRSDWLSIHALQLPFARSRTRAM